MCPDVDYRVVLRRDGLRCWLWGVEVSERDLSFDHTYPLSLGGDHCNENVRVTHRQCTHAKGATVVREGDLVID